MSTVRQLIHRRASSHSMKMHATSGGVSRLYFPYDVTSWSAG